MIHLIGLLSLKLQQTVNNETRHGNIEQGLVFCFRNLLLIDDFLEDDAARGFFATEGALVTVIGCFLLLEDG